MQIYRPLDERELSQVLADSARQRRSLDIQGLGSKRRYGRPIQTAAQLTMRNFRGLTMYEPAEMVVSVRAGTPLGVLEAELAKHNQQLAFEPIDPGAALGEGAGQQTIGGVVATNLSGARRVAAGAVRDHILGLRAVNGRGEIFKNGGRVMKNVTGYDLCRTLAGSWGTLAVFTELTFKTMPRAEETRTLLLFGQPDEIGVEVLCAAMGTPNEVTGAIHLQADLAMRLRSTAGRQGTAVTALRIENFSPSIAYRANKLRQLLSPYGIMEELAHKDSLAFWEELRQLSFLQHSADPVWRISTSPKMGPRVVQAISSYMGCRAAYDWSGGLVWIEVPASADAGAADIRRVIATRGGHATLVRAEPDVRRAVEVFQPLEAGAQRLSAGIKRAFDPIGILNPGRLYAEM